MDKFYPPYFPCYIPLPNGKPAAGGKLYAYFTGTNNLAPLYAEDGTILVGSVADIDSSGQVHILLDPAITYRLKVVPPVGSQMPDQIYDNVRVANAIVGMVNPMTAEGDMIVGGTDGTPEALPKGQQGEVLLMGADKPEWKAGDEVFVPLAGTKAGHPVTGQIQLNYGGNACNLGASSAHFSTLPYMASLGYSGVAIYKVSEGQADLSYSRLVFRNAGSTLQGWYDAKQVDLTNSSNGAKAKITTEKGGEEAYEYAKFVLSMPNNSFYVWCFEASLGYTLIRATRTLQITADEGLHIGAPYVTIEASASAGQKDLLLGSAHGDVSVTAYGGGAMSLKYGTKFNFNQAGIYADSIVDAANANAASPNDHGLVTEAGAVKLLGLTTEGDIIVADASGKPTRLAIGPSGYALISNGTTASWQAQTGFANPMTASGDMIVGGTGGAAARLPVGADYQVLTSLNGAVVWAAPVTQTGDHKSLATSSDTSPDFLDQKIEGSTGVSVAPNGAGDKLVVAQSNRKIELNVQHFMTSVTITQALNRTYYQSFLGVVGITEPQGVYARIYNAHTSMRVIAAVWNRSGVMTHYNSYLTLNNSDFVYIPVSPIAGTTFTPERYTIGVCLVNATGDTNTRFRGHNAFTGDTWYNDGAPASGDAFASANYTASNTAPQMGLYGV